VLAECACSGWLGSALGLRRRRPGRWAGAALLAGDLGGGYFPGVHPALQPGGRWRWPAALGTAAAVAGGWLPARQAERLSPAQALKGLGGMTAARRSPGPAWRCWPPAWRWRCCRLWPACRWPPMPRWPRCCSAAWRWCRRWCLACWRCPAAPPHALLLLALQRAASTARRPARRWPAWWPAWR
jgi:hypothetical protein